MAEIGIILATYNGEKYLREQLDSIPFQIHLKIMRSISVMMVPRMAR